jgi:replication factor C subunit 2/4
LTVHEIAGVVPDGVINSLLAAIGIDTESGMIDLEGNRGGKGYDNVQTTVKKIGRQGYSAGQVLQQVSLCEEAILVTCESVR